MRHGKNSENWNRYSYGLGEKIFRYALLLPFTIITIYAALMTGVGVIACLSRAVSSEPTDCRILWIPFGIFVFTGYLCAHFLNLYPDIRASDHGLAVQVFLFWWIFVPWEHVVDIRPTGLSKLLGSSRSRLVVVRRLAFVHRLIGGADSGFQPAFIIKATMQGYNELVRLIKEKLGKQPTGNSQ
jgi:hypothetical protein